MARYVIRGSNKSGIVEFSEQLTIYAALERAVELRESDFKHITIINVLTGVEITDVEALIQEREKTSSSSAHSQASGA